MSERLFVTNDGEIVPDGHPDAAFLVVGGEGCKVPAEFADAVAEYEAKAKKPAAKTEKKPSGEKAAKPSDAET